MQLPIIPALKSSHLTWIMLSATSIAILNSITPVNAQDKPVGNPQSVIAEVQQQDKQLRSQTQQEQLRQQKWVPKRNVNVN
jgi:hypothetical protein